MLESALAALQSLADPGLLLMLVIGVAAGLVMGLIPGSAGPEPSPSCCPSTSAWKPLRHSPC